MKKAYFLVIFLSVIGINAQTYCTPDYLSGCGGGDQIDDFTLATAGFSHLDTGCSAGSYGDYYATQTITLSPTITYPFTVTHGYQDQYVKVWADFNNNGTFDEATELLGSGSSGSTLLTSGTVTLPASATAGTYRLRVADRWNTAPIPCDVDGYGEAHDYKLIVTAPPTCIAPSAVTTSNVTATSVSVTWTAPTAAPASGYDIFYSNTGVVPTATTVPTMNSATTTASIVGLTPGSNYCVWVRSKCSATDASVWVSSCFVTACIAADVPYFLNFENATVPAVPNCTAVTNAGAGNNWVIANDPGNGFVNNTLTYNYNYQEAANSWFFTQGINLVAGTTYRIKYNYGNNSATYSEKMKVTYGSAATPAAQTNILHDYTNIIDVLTPMTDFYTLTPATSGVYYFGFNVYSDANMYNLYVDDILVEVNPACTEPIAVTVSNITTSGATLAWNGPAAAPSGGYNVYFTTTNTAPTSTSTPNLTVTAATTPLANLAPSTTYYVWVRSNCGSSQSIWVSAAAFTTLATPPVNDNCSTPTVLTPGATFAQNAVTGTNVGATLTSDATATTACQTTRYNDVWYSVVVPASGSITVETQLATGSSVTDTVLGVYSGTCGSLQALDCNDDTTTDAFSRITLTGQTPGATLLIGVWNYSSSTTGDFQIAAYDASLSTSEVAQVKNDLKVYPNPFTDVLNISDVKNVKSISVVDIAGRLVKTFDKPTSNLNLRELNSGLYVLMLNMNDSSKQTIKIIKK
ncbi:fibronectin type III domain-containing protein [Chryseobacterium sp. 09-1422]|uniref:Fibronectin type III domain-containing protein n=1 Tax=Chryseobacterium kimseyorum TaxID=2984028 RepID=A0ABT3HXQ5_9FLAO|nr:GEVED domain-containing protein [Chryseobacterium kimseyorum]MCW3168443.1 fibronectin type III domain-containing protein [Chryseobacterium kimseyorum]